MWVDAIMALSVMFTVANLKWFFEVNIMKRSALSLLRRLNLKVKSRNNIAQRQKTREEPCGLFLI